MNKNSIGRSSVILLLLVAILAGLLFHLHRTGVMDVREIIPRLKSLLPSEEQKEPAEKEAEVQPREKPVGEPSPSADPAAPETTLERIKEKAWSIINHADKESEEMRAEAEKLIAEGRRLLEEGRGHITQLSFIREEETRENVRSIGQELIERGRELIRKGQEMLDQAESEPEVTP